MNEEVFDFKGWQIYRVKASNIIEAQKILIEMHPDVQWEPAGAKDILIKFQQFKDGK